MKKKIFGRVVVFEYQFKVVHKTNKELHNVVQYFIGFVYNLKLVLINYNPSKTLHKTALFFKDVYVF